MVFPGNLHPTVCSGGCIVRNAYTVNSNVLRYVPTAKDAVSDVDGNIYKIVRIGTRNWMAENLKTTRLNDGTEIPFVPDNSSWEALKSPGYCWNNNNSSDKIVYGALYNWYAVDLKKLAPPGWHVATDAEWSLLTSYLNGETAAGGKLKEAGTLHWRAPNSGANDQYGFTALPGGDRNTDGNFIPPGEFGYWWSSTGVGVSDYAFSRTMYYDFSNAYRHKHDKRYGFSVRCVKDNY